MGNPDSEEDRGLIPRICTSLFQQIANEKNPNLSKKDDATTTTNNSWVSQIDPNYNREYWFNTVTEESSWIKPTIEIEINLDDDSKTTRKTTAPTPTSTSTNKTADGVVDVHYKVECSYLEIYNEQVRDLLTGDGSTTNEDDPSITPEHRAFGVGRNKNQSKMLKVREHPKKGPYVEGLRSIGVESYDDIGDLIRIGSASRVVASTQMNSESSRSHAIFKIRFTRTTVNHVNGTATDRVADINLVDLAGSERVQKSGATGTRLREAAAINKSLSTLGQCINKLSEVASGGGSGKVGGGGKGSRGGRGGRGGREGKGKQKVDAFVPYRNSVLTWLLKESFGGNAKTIMLATVRPSSSYYEETLSTQR